MSSSLGPVKWIIMQWNIVQSLSRKSWTPSALLWMDVGAMLPAARTAAMHFFKSEQ